jgi:hypothetical protein
MKYAILAALALLAGAAARVAKSHRATITYLTGMGLLYVGQRMFSEDSLHLVLSGSGAALVVLAAGFRWQSVQGANDSHTPLQRSALTWQLVGSASLVAYGLTLPAVTGALGLTEDTLSQWTTVWSVMWPIAWAFGTVPMVLLDTTGANHPRMVPPGAIRFAIQAGQAVALATALAAPVNYLASEYDQEWDFSYFRVTEPGTSTQALVQNLSAPVEIFLFYPPGNAVKEKLLPYFEELQDLDGSQITVQVVDQPMEPVLAKDMSVRDNGYVVLRMGDAVEKFKIDTDLPKAKRNLKKLDADFQKYMLKLTKGKRTAYMLVGHGEASPTDDNPFFKLGEFKKFLRAQNYDVKDFGLDNGSADLVPDDAALLIIAAPEKALFETETTAITTYIDGGGSVLVYLDPLREVPTGLLHHLGLSATEHGLANAKQFAPMSGGLPDRGNLVTNRFGSHATVATLSKHSSQAAVALISALGISERGEAGVPGEAKYTPLIRSLDGTWEDVDGDFQQGPEESAAPHVLAMAIEGSEATPYRAVVIGDVTIASDLTMKRMAGNAQFALDATRWLIGEEDLAGSINNENDVMINHTRDDDVVWFYSVIFGAPLFILLFGLAAVRSRKQR